MANKIRIEVRKRLIFAKSLLKTAEVACANQADQMVFTRGILLLHDAVENALGAIADHLNVKITGNRYLLDYYELIEKEDPSRKLLYRTQMRNLNTIRNNAKHEGIFPDPQSNSYFTSIVYSLIEEICKTYLGLDFSLISLKELITDEKVLNYINEAEEQIKKEKIKESLISLAYAMYYICEIITLQQYVMDENKTPYQFTKIYDIHHTVDLIGHGVDPYLYYSFKNLTPRIIQHRETQKLSIWGNKAYWHSANWTEQNARFCIDFCIDTALKYQREKDEGFTIENYMDVFLDKIEPAKDEAKIWNRSSKDTGIYIGDPSKQRTTILILKKGESISGWAWDFEHNIDEWFIVSKDITPPFESYNAGFGYVLKSDVKVTSKEMQPPKKSKNSQEK